MADAGLFQMVNVCFPKVLMTIKGKGIHAVLVFTDSVREEGINVHIYRNMSRSI